MTGEQDARWGTGAGVGIVGIFAVAALFLVSVLIGGELMCWLGPALSPELYACS